MIRDCLATIVATHDEFLREFDGGLLAQLAPGLLLALVLAVLLAPFIQWAYSRRMLRFMSFREVAAPPAAWWHRRQRLLRRPPAGQADAAVPLAQAMRLRQRRIRIATIVSYTVFVAGGALALPFYAELGAGDQVTMIAFVALMAAGPALVNVVPHGSKWPLLAGPVIVVAWAAFTEAGIETEEVIYVVIAMVCLHMASVHRTMRALIVPLMVLCTAAIIGLGAAFWSMIPSKCLAEEGARNAIDLALAGGTMTTAVLAFALCLWLGVRVLDALARIVDRGWLSDTSLVAGCGFATVAGLMVMAADARQATFGPLALLFVGWLGAPLAAYAQTLMLQSCPHASSSLLMLRVFSSDRKTERLLDALQSRWRMAGPVLEIGGPDLAKLNLDLYEFVKLASFKLHELFQPTAVPREALAASLDLALDREGRFRVNEVFCFGSSWQTIVERLLALSHAVLLDLRGFGPRRAGTAHEVARLAALGLMHRVVAVVDGHTDWAFFERTALLGGIAQQPALKIDAADPNLLERSLTALVEIAENSAEGTML